MKGEIVICEDSNTKFGHWSSGIFLGGVRGRERRGVGVNHLIRRYLTAFGGKIWARRGRWAEET